MPLLDEAVVNKAVRALLKFHENQRLRKGGGGEPDAMISLQLGLRKVPDASGQAKPRCASRSRTRCAARRRARCACS